MKKTTLILTLGLATLISSTGCKHKAVGVTDIPGMSRPSAVPPGTDTSGTLPSPRASEGGIPMSSNNPYAKLWENPDAATPNRDKFAADTVHFKTDGAAIESGDRSKLDDVAAYFKGNTTDALQVEGYCDERGTEQYNLSLGDKRALSVREYLANLGVDPQRIHTVTFGEGKPVDTGHNESAWKKNRRAELVLLQPK